MRKKLAIFTILIAAILAWGCPPERPTFVTTICKASGELAGEFCPADQREQRRYYVKPQGSEPLAPTELCSVHLAPKPKPGPPWIGASAYQGIVFDIEAVKAYHTKAAGAGQNAAEYFLTGTWPVDGDAALWRWQPYRQVGKWKEDVDGQGPYFYAEWTDQAGQARTKREALTEGPASYPGRWFPLYDLEQPNEQVWTKWAEIFGDATKKGLAKIIRIYDFCSYKAPEDQRHSAFRSNVQRKIDKTLTGGLWGEPIKKYYAALQDRLVRELQRAGGEYFIVPMNEADYLPAPGDSEATKDKAVVDFHRWVRDDLTSRGVPTIRLIASVSRAEAQVQALGYRLEIHGCNSPERMDEYKAKYGAGVSFNGDGFDPYAQGIAGDNPGKRQPSIAQGTAMGERARSWGAFAVLFFAREIESQEPPDIGRVAEAFDVVRAMAKAIWPE